MENINQLLQHVLDDNFKMMIEEEEMIQKKEWKLFLKDFNQIAFDAGHLTYSKENGEFYLKIPNQEMRINFSKMIDEYMLTSSEPTYKTMIFSLLNERFKDFFEFLDQITFQNKFILNLKNLTFEARDQANYEVFLHQACSIAIKVMLIHEKKEKLITDFGFFNEKVISGGKI